MSGIANTGGDQCYNSGLLTATGAETVYDTTVILQYSIGGIMYNKAAVTDGTTPTTDGATGAAFTALGADETCWFAWCINAAGTVALVQGDVVAGDPDTDLPLVFPQLPAVPADHVCFGIQRVHVDGTGSAWTIGTSNWTRLA